MKYTYIIIFVLHYFFTGCEGSGSSNDSNVTNTAVKAAIIASTDDYSMPKVPMDSSAISGLEGEFGGDLDVNTQIFQTNYKSVLLNNETVSLTSMTTLFVLNSSTISDKEVSVKVENYIDKEGYLKQTKITYPKHESILSDGTVDYISSKCTPDTVFNMAATAETTLTCNGIYNASLKITVEKSNHDESSVDYLSCAFIKSTAFDMSLAGYIFKECISVDGEVTSAEYEKINVNF